MSKAIATLFIQLEGSIAKFSKEMGKGAQILDGFGKKAQGIGMKMSALSVPIGAAAGSALRMAGDFEASMNKVEALGNITGKALQDLKSQALELGAQTKYSAKEAADAMGEFAAAGFDADQIGKAMRGTLDLAAAGQLSVARAAEISATTIAQFNMDAAQSGHVADILAAGAAAGSTSVEDLAQALKYVGTVAPMSGQGFEDLVGTLTLLSNSGIKAGDAGTDLAAGFANLLKPTKPMLEALDKIGVKLSDLQTKDGKLKPVVEIIERLNKAGIKGAEIFAIFGKENAKSWSALLDKGAPAINTMTHGITEQEGAARRMADTLNKGLNGALERMGGSVETAGIALGSIMAPMAIKVADAIGALAEKLVVFAQWMEKQPAWIQNTSAALVGLAAVAGPLTLGIGFLAQGFGAFMGVAGKVSLVIPALSKAFSFGVIAVKTFAGALGLLLTPFGAVALAAAAVGVAVYEIYQNWDWIGPMLRSEWEKTKQSFVVVWDFIKQKWNEFWGDFGNGVNVLIAEWNRFWEDFDRGCQVIKQKITELKQWFVDGFNGMVEAVSNMVTAIKTEIQDRLVGILNTVKEPIDKVAGWFAGLYDSVVGHSYIPDMVTRIREEMTALEGEAMVTPAQRATDKTGVAFEGLEKKVGASSKRMQGHLQQIDAAIADIFDDRKVIADPLQKQIESFITSNDVQGLRDFGRAWSDNAQHAKQFRDALSEARKEVEKGKPAQDGLSDSVKKTGDAISEAFGKKPQKEVSALTQQIQSLVQAGDEAGLRSLYEGMNKSTAESDKFNDALEEAKRNITDLKQQSDEWTSNFSSGISQVAQALGVSGQYADQLGNFLGQMFSSSGGQGNAGGGNWLQQAGSFIGGMFGDSSGAAAHSQGIQGPVMESGGWGNGGGAAPSSGGSSSGSGWALAAQAAVAGIEEWNAAGERYKGQFNENRKQVMDSIHSVGMVVANAWTFGLASVVESFVGRENMEKLSIGKHIVHALFGENFETWSRHQFANFVEERFQKLGSVMMFDAEGRLRQMKAEDFNFLEGDKSRFNPGGDVGGTNWGDNFAAMGKETMAMFSGLGTAFTSLLGLTQKIAPQIGYLIATNVNQNIDGARLLVQQLGVSQEDFLKALESAAIKGDISWHDYNVSVAAVNESFKEGLAATGAYGDAFKNLRESGGRGMAAIKSFRDIAVEALESGVKSMEELKARMIAEGADPKEVEALFAAAAQRGINTLEGWRDASNSTAGAIVGDMYAISDSLRSKWDEMKATLDDIYQTIDSIPDEVTKTVNVDVKVNDPNNALNAGDQSTSEGPNVAAARGGVVNGKSLFRHAGGMGLMGERGPEGILPLARVGGKLGVVASGVGGSGTTIVVHAPYSDAGVAEHVQRAIENMRGGIINEAVEAVMDNARRYGGR